MCRYQFIRKVFRILITAIACSMMFQLQGKLVVSEKPTTTIAVDFIGDQGPLSGSGLSRPENITFSPSDDCLAVANILNDSVSFYHRIGDSGFQYEATPSFTLKGTDAFIAAPHDVAFSPCGNYVGVISRACVPDWKFTSLKENWLKYGQGPSINFYRWNATSRACDSQTPDIIIGGSCQDALLPFSFPCALAFAQNNSHFVMVDSKWKYGTIFIYPMHMHSDSQNLEIFGSQRSEVKDPTLQNQKHLTSVFRILKSRGDAI